MLLDCHARLSVAGDEERYSHAFATLARDDDLVKVLAIEIELYDRTGR